MKVNLGCGVSPLTGFVNCDISKHSPWVDLAFNLNNIPWPFPDSSITELVANDVFEHLNKTVQEWLDECWRVLVPSGSLKLRLPAWDNHLSYRDPTHNRVFHPETFFYWDRRTPLHRDFGRFYFAESGKWWVVKSVNRVFVSPTSPGDLTFELQKEV